MPARSRGPVTMKVPPDARVRAAIVGKAPCSSIPGHRRIQLRKKPCRLHFVRKSKLADIPFAAWATGLKGCTVFRPNAVTGAVFVRPEPRCLRCETTPWPGTRGSDWHPQCKGAPEGTSMSGPATDPVCGATVPPDEGVSLFYEGIELRFCSETCQREFLRHPRAYLDIPMAESPSSTPGARPQK